MSIIKTGTFAGLEIIETASGVPVGVDRTSLAVLDALLACFPKDAGADFVADEHGMQGVLVRWKEDNEEVADLWWFDDESHAGLYHWDGETE